MKRKLAGLFFGLILWGTAAPFRPPVAITTTQKIDFAPGGLIRVSHSSGYLKVEGWDRPEVEITATRSMPYDYKLKHPEQAAQRIEAVRVLGAISSDKGLEISTTALPGKRRFTSSVRLDCEIHVPRDSRLVIHHSGGSYVLVSGVNGDIEATSGNGDIVLMLPDSERYSIDAKTKFGIVSSEFSGATRHLLLLGQHFASAGDTPAHRVHLRVGFGGITILAISSEAKVPADSTTPSSSLPAPLLHEVN